MQNRPGCNLDDLVRFWPNGSGPEASRCAGITGPSSGRSQPARDQFPTFRLGCVLAQTPLIKLYKTSPDLIWFWLTVSGFCQTDPVRKQAGAQESSSGACLWPTLPSRSGSDANRIRHVYWVYICLFVNLGHAVSPQTQVA